jgi:hypothetical protein
LRNWFYLDSAKVTMSKHRKAPAEQKVVNEEKRTMVNEVRELRKNNERLMVPDTRKY